MSDDRFLLRPSDQLTKNWGWFLFIGIMMLIVGFICCVYLGFSTLVSVYMISFIILFSGILQVFHAFYTKGWSGFFLWLLAGILYIAAGVISFMYPITAAVIFTYLLGFLLIVAGVFRLIVGFQNKSVSGWGWIVAAGIISILLGIMIIKQWPTSIWVLGMFFAIDLMFQGWSWIAIGLGLKSLRK